MNILLINHYAGSKQMGMEFRPYYMAKEWLRLGHRVTIIAANNSHLRKTNPQIKGSYKEEMIEGIKYLWIKTPSYKSSTKRIINIFSFVIKLLRMSKRIARQEQPDVVINSSTYPMDIYPARKIAKLSGAKLVYEIHDLWPLSPMIIGNYSKHHPFIKVVQRAEDTCYKHCDMVVSLLWNAKEHIDGRGFNNIKIVNIPNGYCQEEWIETNNNKSTLPQEHKQVFDTLRQKNKLIVGYSGGHTPSTSLNTLIEAAEILQKEDIAFVLTGDGISKQSLINLAKEKGLNNVYFLDQVEKTAIAELIENYDIAYMGGVGSVLHRYGTSFNKMTDYMLSSKPIVFSANEPYSLIERVGCGIRVEAENSQEVAEAVMGLLSKTKEERQEMGERGFDYASKNLGYGFLATQMIDYIKEN